MRAEEILVPTAAGLCCPQGGFHVDPTRPVARALITHAHSDHARPGHGAVLATPETIDLMRLRYGENFAGAAQPVDYGEQPASAASRRVSSVRPRARLSANPGRDHQSCALSAPATTRMWPTRPARRLHRLRVMFSLPKRRSGFRFFGMAIRAARSRSCSRLSRCFRSGPILSGPTALGKAQRLIALLARGRLRAADLSARRHRGDHALLCEPYRTRRCCGRRATRTKPSLPALS